jgi:hypothetical protein
MRLARDWLTRNCRAAQPRKVVFPYRSPPPRLSDLRPLYTQVTLRVETWHALTHYEVRAPNLYMLSQALSMVYPALLPDQFTHPTIAPHSAPTCLPQIEAQVPAVRAINAPETMTIYLLPRHTPHLVVGLVDPMSPARINMSSDGLFSSNVTPGR